MHTHRAVAVLLHLMKEWKRVLWGKSRMATQNDIVAFQEMQRKNIVSFHNTYVGVSVAPGVPCEAIRHAEEVEVMLNSALQVEVSPKEIKGGKY